jgi:hypothetical protein
MKFSKVPKSPKRKELSPNETPLIKVPQIVQIQGFVIVAK